MQSEVKRKKIQDRVLKRKQLKRQLTQQRREQTSGNDSKRLPKRASN